MPTYTRPGVFVSETPLRNNVVRPDSGSTAAFFGTSTRGPATPTLVDSWSMYRSLFGELDQSHDLGFAVYQYFANGGRVAYVTRVVSGASSTAPATAALTYTPATGGSVTPLVTLTAKSPGTWGNSLSAAVSAGRVLASATQVPTFNLSLTYSGVEVESWSELSADPSSSRYITTVLNEYSSFVSCSESTAVAADGFSYTIGSATFASGNNGNTLDSNDYGASLALLNDVEGALIINCVGQHTAAVVNAALQVAEARGNSFVVVDPDPAATTAVDINNLVSTYTETSYGAVYYPMLRMVDPSKSGPGAVRTTYPGGAIVGAYARIDATRTVAKTPAGYDVDIRNALGLASAVTDALVSAVYDNGVNCLKAVPGGGVVILGGRTLRTSRPDQYIAVRRTLNFVKQGVSELVRPSLFEPNTERLWNRLDAQVRQFLTTFWGAGGLKGRTADEAFYVVCDETNNTGATIDNGEVHIEIGVAVQYPAEFIVINVSEWAGGSNSTETI